MKKLSILLGLLFGSVFIGNAQQLPLYSQYMLNGFLLNPAQTGNKEYSPIRITARQQYVGFKNAPSTQAVSYHTPLKRRHMGLGGYLFNDQFGPISKTGILLAYAYHMEIQRLDSKLSFGLSASVFQFSLNEKNIHTLIPEDAAISGAMEKSIAPDCNFGVQLFNGKYFVGIAGTQLLEYKLKIGSESNSMVRHYYAMGGYRFNLFDQFELEPSALLKTTEKSPPQVDINIKTYYKKDYWLGVSYRAGYGQTLITLIGCKIDKFYVAYAYDFSFTNIQKYSTGSHEIMVGMDIGKAYYGSALL